MNKEQLIRAIKAQIRGATGRDYIVDWDVMTPAELSTVLRLLKDIEDEAKMRAKQRARRMGIPL
jgi:predicted Fe-S protein YdhL (DUF1289 family)